MFYPLGQFHEFISINQYGHFLHFGVQLCTVEITRTEMGKEVKYGKIGKMGITQDASCAQFNTKSTERITLVHKDKNRNQIG
jgi:hypothetical protein